MPEQLFLAYSVLTVYNDMLHSSRRLAFLTSGFAMTAGTILLQAAVDLSEAQVQDLLYLRHLFCGKIGQLKRARLQLVAKLSSDTADNCHVTDKLAQLTSLTEQLRANGSEEYRAHMQLTSAMCRGVSVLMLTDCATVHAYTDTPCSQYHCLACLY